MYRKFIGIITALTLAAGYAHAADVRDNILQLVVDSVAVVDINFVTETQTDTVTVVELTEYITDTEDNAISQNVSDNEEAKASQTHASSWAIKPKAGPEGLHFVWGADVGSTIDMSGKEMSSIDINAAFGVGYKWLNFAGIGAGANIVVSNSYRIYPIYAMVRSDFSNLVKFVFLDLRGGIALNYLSRNVRQTGGYVSPSIGFNLATGTTFRSYITVGYTYLYRKDMTVGDDIIPYSPLSMATVRLGVAF